MAPDSARLENNDERARNTWNNRRPGETNAQTRRRRLRPKSTFIVPHSPTTIEMQSTSSALPKNRILGHDITEKKCSFS